MNYFPSLPGLKDAWDWFSKARDRLWCCTPKEEQETPLIQLPPIEETANWEQLQQEGILRMNLAQQQGWEHNQNSSSLSVTLKTKTQQVHTEIEQHPFLQALVQGNLSKKVYGKYLRDLLEIYLAMEEIFDQPKEYPQLVPLCFPQVRRCEAIKADLQFFEAQSILPSNASIEYASHLRTLAKSHPHLLLAHFYVRYLGDLSGGQILRKKILNQWKGGVAFNTFEQISNISEFKKRYREVLDNISLTKEEKEEIVQEALTAFSMNEKLFNAAYPSSEKKRSITL